MLEDKLRQRFQSTNGLHPPLHDHLSVIVESEIFETSSTLYSDHYLPMEVDTHVTLSSLATLTKTAYSTDHLVLYSLCSPSLSNLNRSLYNIFLCSDPISTGTLLRSCTKCLPFLSDPISKVQLHAVKSTTLRITFYGSSLRITTLLSSTGIFLVRMIFCCFCTYYYLLLLQLNQFRPFEFLMLFLLIEDLRTD